MATPEQMKSAIVKQDQPTSLQAMIQKASKELGRALPSHLNPERLVRIALTSIRLNPELATCTPESFLGALFVLAQVGLEPVAGRAYLLPFNNKRKIGNEWRQVKEVQAIIGYKGYVDLFFRHESALSIDVQTVKENDDFQYEYGTNAFIKHKPALSNRGKSIAFYAVGRMKGGASVFRVMSAEECLEHGKEHSKTYDKNAGKFYGSSPWATDFDAMAMKTCILQLSKLLPLSVELQRALQVDETSRDYRQGIDDVLDLPITTEWEKPVQIEEKPQTSQPVVTVSPADQLRAENKTFGKRSDKPLSEAQVKFLWAKMKSEMKFDDEQSRMFFKEATGVDSTSDMVSSDVDKILAHIEKVKREIASTKISTDSQATFGDAYEGP